MMERIEKKEEQKMERIYFLKKGGIENDGEYI